MPWYVEYDIATGEVLRLCSAPDSMMELQSAPRVVLPNNSPVDPAAHHVVGGQLVAKSEFPGAWSKTTVTADGLDAALLAPVPNGARVYVDQDYMGDVTGGEVEFTATSPGVYIVRVESVPYFPKEWEITAE